MPIAPGAHRWRIGVPLHHHGFVTNWGLGMIVGVINFYHNVGM